MKALLILFLLSFPAVSLAVKYHPGHYVSLRPGDDSGTMISSATIAGVKGVQIRYSWRELESGPSGGIYDFSRIRSDLVHLTGARRHLIAMIEDKSFDGTDPLPDYLADYRIYSNASGGYIAQRWHPFVVQRMTALMTALGRQFDSASYFEGVAFQETSVGLNDSLDKAFAYTPEAYRDALIKTLIATQLAFPGSKVFWYMNFFRGHNSYIAQIADTIAHYGVAMGGPDILPDNASLQNVPYPYYTQFAGRMPLFCSSQNDSYGHLHDYTTTASYTFTHKSEFHYSTKYWTPQEISDFAVRELHVNYVIWNRKTWRDPSDSYWFNDAIPVFLTPTLEIRDSPAGGVMGPGPAFSVSPNPVKGSAQLRFSEPLKSAEIVVTDVLGRRAVHLPGFSGQGFYWDSKGTASGIHFIAVRMGQHLFRCKIVQQ